MIRYVFDLKETMVVGSRLDSNDSETKEFMVGFAENSDDIHRKLEDALGIVKRLLKNEKIDESFELGIAIPGVIDNINNRVLNESVFKDVNIDIDKYFSEFTNLSKLVIENNGKAATIGEYHHSETKKMKNVFVIQVGFGIGAGAIINGKLLRGDHNFAGEYSRMYTNLTDSKALSEATIYCGTAQARYRLSTIRDVPITDISWDYLMSEYYEHKSDVMRIFEMWITSVAKLIINVNLILDVDAVIIGDMAAMFKPFPEGVTKKLLELGKITKLPTPKIIVSSLGLKAARLGLLEIMKGKQI